MEAPAWAARRLRGKGLLAALAIRGCRGGADAVVRPTAPARRAPQLRRDQLQERLSGKVELFQDLFFLHELSPLVSPPRTGWVLSREASGAGRFLLRLLGKKIENPFRPPPRRPAISTATTATRRPI